jgi:hypothetical protein
MRMATETCPVCPAELKPDSMDCPNCGRDITLIRRVQQLPAILPPRPAETPVREGARHSVNWMFPSLLAGLVLCLAFAVWSQYYRKAESKRSVDDRIALEKQVSEARSLIDGLEAKLQLARMEGLKAADSLALYRKTHTQLNKEYHRLKAKLQKSSLELAAMRMKLQETTVRP